MTQPGAIFRQAKGKGKRIDLKAGLNLETLQLQGPALPGYNLGQPHLHLLPQKMDF